MRKCKGELTPKDTENTKKTKRVQKRTKKATDAMPKNRSSKAQARPCLGPVDIVPAIDPFPLLVPGVMRESVVYSLGGL